MDCSAMVLKLGSFNVERDYRAIPLPEMEEEYFIVAFFGTRGEQKPPVSGSCSVTPPQWAETPFKKNFTRPKLDLPGNGMEGIQ